VASFDEVVPPGKAGSIHASVHTASYKGPIGKSVTVNHDDKSQGPIQLNMTANIVGSVEILPYPALQLARQRRGFTTPALLIVRKDATETGTLKFDRLAASVPWLKVSSRVVKTEEPPVEGLPAAVPGDIVLSVQATTGAPPGSSVEKVTFNTGLTREPEVSVPVTVFVQAAVTLQPNDLILNPTPEAAAAAHGEVLASLRDDLDPKSLTVNSESPAFTVKIDPPGALAFRILVDWTGKGKKPATATTVHVHAGKETVDLPVRVILPKAATP
jgi:hypothetical protein